MGLLSASISPYAFYIPNQVLGFGLHITTEVWYSKVEIHLLTFLLKTAHLYRALSSLPGYN